ncbi:hypothetical protein B0I27_105247 [Arcticibacter pallidicorallinus]|uniref:Uncharacterized protein n=1 Tax=Arcticibacter pallidicorallinus TaxID=1259464 RepID=A0A2T0U4L5_9SPHI|nr:prealbumin-like fold domain-containing protein [Arcticibacter pallidicorallinus]PRY52778.1 hypothetical protein B0I27_105247 [Arcticibacter pallidicorallinus]
MKPKLVFLLLLSVVIISCKKTTIVDVAPSNSGKLIYKLTDDAGKGLPGVAISLFAYEGVYSDYQILLDKQVTDVNGQIDFGDLNPDKYLIRADSVKVNDLTYVVHEYVEVSVAATTRREVKATDFSAQLTITVRSYNDEKPMKSVGVMVVPTNKIYNEYTTASNSKIADYKGVTNSSGLIKIKIPCYKQYKIYLYDLVTNSGYRIHDVFDFFLEKDEKANSIMRISP